MRGQLVETPRNTVRSPRAKIRGLVQRALATLGVLAVALTGAVVAAAPAQAATAGYGLGTWGDREFGYFGSFRAPSDGALIYCFQPSMPAPLGATGAGILSGPGENGLPSDPNLVAGMNRVISTYGQSTDPVQAMAVMKTVQALATSPATVITQYGNDDGTTWGDLAAWVQPSGVALTDAQQAQFVAQVTEYYGIGLDTVAGGGSGTPSGTLDFAIVGTNDYNGTVTANATGTSGTTTGTIVLTNAVFNSTGTNTLAGAQIGVPYEFTGTPANPEWDASDYSVSGTGNFTTGGDGYAANLTVYLTPDQQSAAGAGTRSQTDFTLSGADPAARGVSFAPIVETQVSSIFLEDGDIPADSLLFGTQADALSGVNNPWFRSSGGRYAPVTAEGVLYGPTTGAPVQSPSVPANAEIAATATVTTDAATDPTATPTIVEASNAVTEAGFYTWVWTITDTMQRDSVREFLPSPYSYSHDYGLVPETSIRGMQIGAVSQVTEEELSLGGTTTDTLAVSAPINGNWIERDGGKVPVTYRASTYFVTDEPVRADTVPADAELLATQTHTVSRPGTITADPVTVPVAEGYVVWVWDILDADQAIPGFVDEWTDGWATPREIAQVIAPEVTTNAQPGAKLGEEPGLFDVATVTDPIPAAPTTLDFEAFKVPVVKDATTGEWVIDYPEDFVPSEEPGANNLSWVCEAEPVFTTEESITVTEAGEYTSESFVPEEFGKYLWVETLTVTPEGGDPVVVHRGECGIAEESGVIVDVTTKAQTDNGDQIVDNGEQAWDTAILNGYVPEGATVTIVGYQTSESTPVTEACTAENKVFEWTSEPLTGGMAENLEIDSAKFTPAKLGNDSKVYFIETTKDALGRTVSTGECGEPDETLGVKGDGTIAFTGGSDTPALWVGGAALLALFGAAGVYMIRRRQTA